MARRIGPTARPITSLGRSVRARNARESNDVLRDRGWDPLPAPVDLTLEPARF